MINGVRVWKPEVFPDERGTVRRFVRVQEDVRPIRECYTTTIYRGVVKGWHGYIGKTLAYSVPHGNIKMVLYDIRENSTTHQDFDEIFLGQDNYMTVIIPPGVMSAFMGLSDPYALAVVCSDEIFDESRTIRMAHKDIEYDWSIKNK